MWKINILFWISDEQSFGVQACGQTIDNALEGAAWFVEYDGYQKFAIIRIEKDGVTFDSSKVNKVVNYWTGVFFPKCGNRKRHQGHH